MVAMRMGDEDVAQPLALDRREQRLDMRIDRRPRIDDRDIAVAENIAASAGEGEGARIGRDDAARRRRDADERARRGVEYRDHINSAQRYDPFAGLAQPSFGI